MRRSRSDSTPHALSAVHRKAAPTADRSPRPGQAYIAALVATAGLLPIVAAAVTVAGDQVDLGPFGMWATSSHTASGSALVLCSFAIGTAVWLTAAAWYRHLTGPHSANPSSFNQLRPHLHALDARLDVLGARPDEQLVRAEAAHYRDLLAEELASAGDVRWVTATGYVTAWTLMHRAEELLMLIAPRDDLLRSGFYDLTRLQNAHLDNRDDLLRNGYQALRDLGVPRYLLARRVGHHAPSRPAAADGLNGPRAGIAVLDEQERQARLVLVGIRRAINEHRDSKYAGLVQARNRAARTMTITAFATYGLLALAAIDGVSKQTMVRAMAIFLVGALVGLFSRLFDESRADASATIEDYGLATMRLLTRPLLSGLAALAGVVMTISLPSAVTGAVPTTAAAPMHLPIGTAQQTAEAGTAALALTSPNGTVAAPTSGGAVLGTGANLSNIFAIENDPFALVIAAIFGLTPGLLFGRLQKQTEELKADLRASAPGGQVGQREQRTSKRVRR